MNGIVSYFRESWEELKRVSWPTRDEVLQGTQTVLIYVIMMTLIFWVMDLIFRGALTNGLFRLVGGG
jgi:preprotein translocase subunit SecE